jgi:hypothetical protein
LVPGAPLGLRQELLPLVPEVPLELLGLLLQPRLELLQGLLTQALLQHLHLQRR